MTLDPLIARVPIVGTDHVPMALVQRWPQARSARPAVRPAEESS